MRVHISANVEVLTGGRHRSCWLCMTRVGDRVHRRTHRHNDEQNDQSHDLLQYSLRSIGEANNTVVLHKTLYVSI